MELLNNLPSIIDSLGEYKMRNGDKAVIIKLNPPNPDTTTTCFDAKGYAQKYKNGKWINECFSIWHTSGRYYPLQTSSFDIIGKWS